MTMVDGGGGHWLVWMEWCPAGWSMCLPLLIFPCIIKSRSSLLAPADPSGPRKRAVKWLWWYVTIFVESVIFSPRLHEIFSYTFSENFNEIFMQACKIS